MINDQSLISNDPDVKLAFYGLHGSLHYPIQADSIHSAICNVGATGSTENLKYLMLSQQHFLKKALEL